MANMSAGVGHTSKIGLETLVFGIPIGGGHNTALTDQAGPVGATVREIILELLKLEAMECLTGLSILYQTAKITTGK